MVSCVIVLVGAIIGVVAYNNYQASLEPEEESSSIVLKNFFEYDTEDIASINLVTSSDSITLVPGDYSADGTLKWVLEDHTDWSLKNTYTSLVSMAKLFQVYKEIDTGVDEARLADFGLDNPSSIFTVNLKDGTSSQVYIGNRSTDGEYAYCMLPGDDTVYACNSTYATYGSYTKEYLRLASITSLDTDADLYSIFVQQKGEKAIEIRYTGDDKADDSDSSDAYSSYITSSYEFVQPYDGEVVSVIQGLASSYFANLTTPEYIETIEVTCTDFDQYGLGDEPEYRETIVTRTEESDGTYTYATTDYLFGYTYGDGAYIYFREAGSDFVMGVDATCLDVRQFTPFYYVNKLVFLESINNISSGTISYEGETHNFSVKRSDASSDEDLATYRFDGELIDDETILAMYRLFISIAPDYEILDQVPDYDENEKLEFTVTYNDGQEQTITYYRLSEFYYVTQVEDNIWFACSHTYVDKFLAQLEACVEATSN
jgi:hypothetical protein